MWLMENFGCLHACMHICLRACIHVYMLVCMYAWICRYVHALDDGNHWSNGTLHTVVMSIIHRWSECRKTNARCANAISEPKSCGFSRAAASRWLTHLLQSRDWRPSRTRRLQAGRAGSDGGGRKKQSKRETSKGKNNMLRQRKPGKTEKQ